MKRLNLSVRRPSIRTGLIAAIGSLAVVSGVIAASAVMSMKSMDRQLPPSELVDAGFCGNRNHLETACDVL